MELGGILLPSILVLVSSSSFLFRFSFVVYDTCPLQLPVQTRQSEKKEREKQGFSLRIGKKKEVHFFVQRRKKEGDFSVS